MDIFESLSLAEGRQWLDFSLHQLFFLFFQYIISWVSVTLTQRILINALL